MKNTKNWVIISLLAVILVLSVLIVNLYEKPIVSEEKAMLTAVTIGWAKNMYNSSELIFQLSLFNYGYSEGKNVEITCGLYDVDENGYLVSDTFLVEFTRSIGNIASTSFKELELYTDRGDVVLDDYDMAFCFPISCDNCILLNQRIPELQP